MTKSSSIQTRSRGERVIRNHGIPDPSIERLIILCGLYRALTRAVKRLRSPNKGSLYHQHANILAEAQPLVCREILLEAKRAGISAFCGRIFADELARKYPVWRWNHLVLERDGLWFRRPSAENLSRLLEATIKERST